MTMSIKGQKSIGIIGTGEYARALAKRLLFCGYDVIFGSRRPDRRNLSSFDQCFSNVVIETLESCISQCDILFIAIHAENYKDSLSSHKDIFQGKIILDVSNRDNPSTTESNAEMLSMLVPTANVVKAFNVVRSRDMDNETYDGNKSIFVAGNNPVSRDIICALARDIGFSPVDLGSLNSARKIEAFPIRLFPNWKAPILLTVGIFNIWLLYVVFSYFIQSSTQKGDQLFIKVLNKPISMTAITLMAITYVPSLITALLQLYYGTKHKIFPKWLSLWLKARKRFGVITFFLICVHVMMSCLTMNPTYFKSWYKTHDVTITANVSSATRLPVENWMSWEAEASLLLGILSFIAFCVVALSLLPSVQNTLNFRELRFLQKKIGYLSLTFAVGHVIILGTLSWLKKDAAAFFESFSFLSIVIPCVTLFVKLLLASPCIAGRLQRIRRGYDRKYDIEQKLCRKKCTKKKCLHEEEGMIPNDSESPPCRCTTSV